MDEYFDSEKQKSINLMKEKTKELEEKDETYNTCILIDDYNPKKQILNLKDFKKILELQNATPNIFYSETDLADIGIRSLEFVNPKIAKEYRKYIEEKKKVPCSLCIVAWYLLRLGLIQSSDDSLKLDSISDNIVTIIPLRYQESEKKALKIIKNSEFNNYINNIHYVYY